jgi:hypothetical protein
MEKRPSTLAWGALVTGVLAWDLLCPPGETLSEGLDNTLESPKGRLLLYTAIGVTALHLANILPDKFDPLHQVSQYLNHIKE